MKHRFILNRETPIDLRKDCYWELYQLAKDSDPRFRALVIEDFQPLDLWGRIRFKDNIISHLNRCNVWDFEITPSYCDRLFLHFNFNDVRLTYNFSYDLKGNWYCKTRQSNEIYCVAHNISGKIENPMMLLLE